MYISLPKNYSGSAFAAENGRQVQSPTETPVAADENAAPPLREAHHTFPVNIPATAPKTDDSTPPTQKKKPLTAFLDAVRKRQENGISGDDLLLMGLISLLAGKEDNGDIVGILTLLLLL